MFWRTVRDAVLGELRERLGVQSVAPGPLYEAVERGVIDGILRAERMLANPGSNGAESDAPVSRFYVRVRVGIRAASRQAVERALWGILRSAGLEAIDVGYPEVHPDDDPRDSGR